MVIAFRTDLESAFLPEQNQGGRLGNPDSGQARDWLQRRDSPQGGWRSRQGHRDETRL